MSTNLDYELTMAQQEADKALLTVIDRMPSFGSKISTVELSHLQWNPFWRLAAAVGVRLAYIEASPFGIDEEIRYALRDQDYSDFDRDEDEQVRRIERVRSIIPDIAAHDGEAESVEAAWISEGVVHEKAFAADWRDHCREGIASAVDSEAERSRNKADGARKALERELDLKAGKLRSDPTFWTLKLMSEKLDLAELRFPEMNQAQHKAILGRIRRMDVRERADLAVEEIPLGLLPSLGDSDREN